MLRPLKHTAKQTGIDPGSALNTLTNRIGWVLAAAFAAVLLLTPLIALFGGVFIEGGAAWQFITETLLADYSKNTMILIVGVGGLALLLGGSLAVLVSLYDFPGVRWLRPSLLLSLAIPSYIAAYAFVGMFEYSGPMHQLFLAFGMQGVHTNIMHLPGLIIVLALVLYPYVYATARVALESRYNSYIESAKSLGMSNMRTLRKIILPLLQPALAGGVFLVMMEVLNDYGAMKYFGIPTFTTGIFKAWFSMGDLVSAVRLAFLLFIIVILLSAGEGFYHRKHKVSESNRSSLPRRTKLKGVKAALATTYAVGIFTISFAAPVSYLLWLFSYANRSRAAEEWFSLASNSMISGLSGTLLVLFFVLLTQFVRQLVRNKMTFIISRSISVGYTIPGAIIAIGMLIIASLVSDIWTGVLISGTLPLLAFAYAVRFAGVAYQPLNAESEKRSGRLFEAAQSLGKNTSTLLRRIFIPLTAKGTVMAASLVLIDILKELPLTLILRPFNFDTLATKAFEYADDELLAQAALPALSVILVGTIPVLLLHRSMKST